jgi:GNAT superfamily N-acetyltransferase
MIIRHATKDDVPLILSFLRAKAEFDGCPEKLEATEESLTHALFRDLPLMGVLLAETAGEAVGFVTYFYTYSSFLSRQGIWLDDLFVVPEQRGGGIGTALLVELARTAREEGCGRIDWTVAAANAPAIRFYQKHGAQLLDHTRLCRLDRAEIEVLAGDSFRFSALWSAR